MLYYFEGITFATIYLSVRQISIVLLPLNFDVCANKNRYRNTAYFRLYIKLIYLKTHEIQKMELNLLKFTADSNLNQDSFRLGSTELAYTLEINSSNYHKECWWTLGEEITSISANDTTFAYSTIEGGIAGIICALLGMIGTVLNFLLIVGLLRNPEIRKEYMTKSIVSIAITDLLFSVFLLPIMSFHYFTG